MVFEPDFKSRHAELLAKMDAFFAEELLDYEGNVGLTGKEADDELEDDGDLPVLYEIRTLIDFRTQLRAHALEMGMELPIPEADQV